MQLKEFSQRLTDNRWLNTYKKNENGYEKVIISQDEKFNEYVVETDGILYIKCFIKDKPVGEKYTIQDYYDCTFRRNFIINKFNEELNLGIKFNGVGDTNPEIE